MKKISVLIPIYNEQDSLPRLFERVGTLMDSNIGYEWEKMIFNDVSYTHLTLPTKLEV